MENYIEKCECYIHSLKQGEKNVSDTHCCNTFGLVTAYRVPRLHWDINRDDLRTGHVVRISANHHPPPPKFSMLMVHLYTCMIYIINEIFTLLECYAAYFGSYLPTFRYNILVLSSRVLLKQKPCVLVSRY
jgi:hypothetical protein